MGVIPDPLDERNAGKMALEIARGRLAFSFYYENAKQAEVDLFDALYLAHLGLSIGVNAPRAALAPQIQQFLEAGTSRLEQTYMELLGRVRMTAAFWAIKPEQREKIETDLAIRFKAD